MTNDIDSSATPTGPAPIATFDGVTRRYGRVTAVDGLSLQIGSGETVALLGPNGAGKTTAVELLLGLAQPDAGVVRLFGGPPADAVAAGIVPAAVEMMDTLAIDDQLEPAEEFEKATRASPARVLPVFRRSDDRSVGLRQHCCLGSTTSSHAGPRARAFDRLPQ